MIPFILDFSNKKILIVGGGKVAKRKALQFIKEGAHVKVVALTCNFLDLDIEYIQASFDASFLEDVFWVIAATDDLKLNEEIASLCNKKNIPCNSVSQNAYSDAYSMAYLEEELWTLSLFSKGAFPYTKPLLNKMNEVLEKEKERFEKLIQLRPFIIEKIEDKEAYISLLYECPLHYLDYLLKKDHKLLVSYDGKNPFNDYLCLSYAEVLKYHLLFDLLDFEIITLFIQEGQLYKEVQEVFKKAKVQNLFSLKDYDWILEGLKVQKEDAIFLHSSKNKSLKNYLSEKGYDVYELKEPLLKKTHRIIPLLMTNNQHYQKLLSQYPSIQIETPLLENEWIIRQVNQLHFKKV